MATIMSAIIGGEEFSLYAETWETRNAWGHKCTLFLNNREIARARCTYYNRTWEGWEYQSVMLWAVDNALKESTQRAVDAWKDATGRKVCRKAERERIASECAEVQMLTSLKRAIDTYDADTHGLQYAVDQITQPAQTPVLA